MTRDLEDARQEVRRRDALVRGWLGFTTQGRPSFAEAERLDTQGIPACHVWQIPNGPTPTHLSATAAIRAWQDGACAACGAVRIRLLVDHDHRTGLIRGLLCPSCNTAEGVGNSPTLAAYRERPPAVMLGVEEQYGSVWDGFGVDPAHTEERNAAHVDAAEAVFSGLIGRFRPDA